MEHFKKWFAVMLRVAYIRQGSAGHLSVFRKFDDADIAFTSKHDKVLSDLLRKAKDAQDAVDHYIIARSKE